MGLSRHPVVGWSGSGAFQSQWPWIDYPLDSCLLASFPAQSESQLCCWSLSPRQTLSFHSLTGCTHPPPERSEIYSSNPVNLGLPVTALTNKYGASRSATSGTSLWKDCGFYFPCLEILPLGTLKSHGKVTLGHFSQRSQLTGVNCQPCEWAILESSSF